MEQESQKETYLDLLKATLMKKSEILNQLIHLTKEQETLINNDNIDDERFNETIDKKEVLIQSIIHLDEGFEQVYQRVKEELSTNRKVHQARIFQLQELIKKITDHGIQLQVIEKRNKAKMEAALQTKRSRIKKFNINNKSITSYYSNMTGQNQQESYFFDKKK